MTSKAMRTAATTKMRRRLLAGLLIPLLLAASTAPIAWATPITVSVPAAAQPKSVRKGPKKVNLFSPTVKFSSTPTDQEIKDTRVFLNPLLPTEASSIPGENEALAKAISSYKAQNDSEDISEFKTFIADYPNSRWRQALEVNLGRKLFESGYLTEALSDWRSTWDATKSSKVESTREIANQAVSEMMILEARLGLTEQLGKDVSATEKRSMFGSNELRMAQAKLSVKEQTALPGKSYRCGPIALGSVLNAGKKNKVADAIVTNFKSTKDGTNLAQLKTLADKAGIKLQIAKRSTGAPLVVPSVMHWRLGHFAALTDKKSDKYHIQDPTFDENGSVWLKQKAIDTESDGYFLIPEGPLLSGWTAVSMANAAKVWGKGTVVAAVQGKTPSQPHENPCIPCQKKAQMAVAECFLFQGTLNIHDTPLRYQTPVGPSVEFLVNYNYQEGNQPSTFSFTNLGQDWSLNWVSYLTVDASKNATVHVRGGGYETYNYAVPDNVGNPYVPDITSQAQLKIISVGVYQRQLTDGSIEVFNQPDGSGRIFMTQVIDPQGNSAYIQYDSNFRLTTITDTIGQVSQVSYLSDTPGIPDFYVVSKIEDPFQRTAQFGYDSTHAFLLSSTDQTGLVSKFSYDTGSSFINLMTTPYGSTGFSTTFYTNNYAVATGTRFDYPDGTAAVIENFGGYANASYYWDRETMMRYPLDYTTLYGNYAKSTVWTASGESEPYMPVPVATTYSSPIDYPISYTYAGQGIVPDHAFVSPGPLNKPTVIQQGDHTWNYQYNVLGKITQSVDPIGRTCKYMFAANNIDLLEKRQTRAGNNDLLGKWQYNNPKHLPNKYIDGSGQVTTMVYNTFGELLTITNPNGDVWTNTYDSSGYLTQVDGPLAGNQDKITMGYDSFGRIYQVTDSEGYVITYSYDDGDRLVQVTYPDGTFEQYTYSRLDVVMSKDRLGRWSKNVYDSMDQMIASIDPLSRMTEYRYCSCGAVSKLTDPLGRSTYWTRDLEARVASKTMDDQTSITYTRDRFGRIVNKLDAMGQQTNYAYNFDDTLSSKTYTNAIKPTSEVDYSWDPNYARISSIKNGWGTYSYNYVPYITDPFSTPTEGGGKLYSITNNVLANSDVIYSYDNIGRISSRSINGSDNSSNWTYDAISRITNETNPLGSFDFHYVDNVDGASKGVVRLSSISYPNGQITNYSWLDNLGDQRLAQINHLTPSAAQISQFNYQYNPAGEITEWGQQIGTKAVSQYKLGYDQAAQLISSDATLGNSSAPAASRSNYIYDDGSNRIALQHSAAQTISLSGTATTGDTLAITITDAGLSAGLETFNYTVVAGDTLTTIATKIAAGLTSTAALQTIGVNAASASNLITVRSTSQNPTTYQLNTTSGATEIMTQGVTLNGTHNVTVGGSLSLSDTLTVTVSDVGLSGGTTSVNFVVPAGASLASIATGLASAVNANTSLQAIGVSAHSFGTTASISSTSVNATTFAVSTNSGATETLSLEVNRNGVTTGIISGTVTAGNLITLNVLDNSLTGGSQTVTYTVLSTDNLSSVVSAIAAAVNSNTALQNIGVTATSSNTVLNLRSTSLNATTYSSNSNLGATATLALAPSVGIQQSAYNSVNELISQSAGGAVSIIGNTNKPIASISAASSNIRISASPLSSTISGTLAPLSHVSSLVFGTTGAGIDTLAITGVQTTLADQFILTIKNPSLPGGQETVSYTQQFSDRLADIYAGVQNAINNDVNLQAVGFSATTVPSTTYQYLLQFNQKLLNNTTYTASTSSGATESLSLGVNNNGNIDMGISGVITAGDTITISATNPGASSPTNLTYMVNNTDSLTSTASNIATLINSNSSIASREISASSSVPGNLLWSERFQTQPILSNGQNIVNVSGTDGAGNQKKSAISLITSPSSQKSLTFDLDGNLTSDGDNVYSWDAENRLVQITYPGAGNFSQFSYDSFNRCTVIDEYFGGTQASAKKFVLSNAETCESRESLTNLRVRYYKQGEIVGSAAYTYSKDHLHSIVSLQDNSGDTQAQTNYDMFGQILSSHGTTSPDFGYANYYNHSRSGLNITTRRFYSPRIGRWLNRDPIQESGGLNLYAYVSNHPPLETDPSGLFDWQAIVDLFEALTSEGMVAAPEIVEIGTGLEEAIIAESPADTAELAAIKNVVQQAEEDYPNLAGKMQDHHFLPRKYGGDAGPCIRLPAPYHNLITQAFRSHVPNGTPPPTETKLILEILKDVYSQYPIKGFDKIPAKGPL